MYEHTQRSTAMLFLNGLMALIPVGLWLSGALQQTPFGVQLMLFVVVLVMLTTAFVFSSFTIAIRDGQLTWWFGPGVVKKTIPLALVASAEPTTTSLINGWGIHLTTRGWLYNIAGRQAVFVTLKDGRSFLLGTDEPDRLANAITKAAFRSD